MTGGIKPKDNIIASLPEFCLSDFYIIQKWIDYAKGIGDQSSEIFNETKIRRGINKAFEKRKISSDEIDELLQKVLTKCSQYPNKEIPSAVIGETIMRELILIDQVAYLRFASVYLRFDDVNSFKSIIENIEKQPSPSMLKDQKKIEIDE